MLYQTAAPGSTYQNAGTLLMNHGQRQHAEEVERLRVGLHHRQGRHRRRRRGSGRQRRCRHGQAAANAAQAAADAAASAAATADGKAVTAQATANGKNKIIFSTAAASRHRLLRPATSGSRSQARYIIAQWEFVAGAVGVAETLDNAVHRRTSTPARSAPAP